MKAFNIYTLPHTGTRFAFSFLKHLGFKRTQVDGRVEEPELFDNDVTYSQFHAKWMLHYNEVGLYIASTSGERKTLTTLQDPKWWAVSWLSRRLSNEEGEICWTTYLREIEKMDIVYLDIRCPEEYRKTHLISILKQLDVYDGKYDTLIDEFVSSMWVKVGSKETSYHKIFRETGQFKHHPDTLNELTLDLLPYEDWYYDKLDHLESNGYDIPNSK
jgi:rhodanese-related sulfurtransferase